MEKKKQHTVPTCYLENFTDQNGALNVLKVDKLFQTKPSAILTDNHFYTIRLPDGRGSFIVEDTLANIEGTFATIFREKVSKGLPFDKSEKAHLAVFIAAMMLRTRAHRKRFERFFGEVKEMTEHMRGLPEENKRALASMPHSDGESIPADELIKMGEDLSTFQGKLLISTLPEVSSLIFRMKWVLIVCPKDEYFLTSDNPFCMVNPDLIAKYGERTMISNPGLGQKGVEISIPLSSGVTLLGGWILKKEGCFNADSAMVKQFNSRTIRNAAELIACSPDMLEEIRQGVLRRRSEKAKDHEPEKKQEKG